MNSERSDWQGRGPSRGLRAAMAVIVTLLLAPSSMRAADDAREIVGEAQRRSDSKSQRYEGILQTFDANGKTTEKRWIQIASAPTAKAKW